MKSAIGQCWRDVEPCAVLISSAVMVLGKRAKTIQYCRGQSGASGASGIGALLRAGQIELGQGALLYSPRHFSSGALNWFGGPGRASGAGARVSL